jgi:hypothetical protein
LAEALPNARRRLFAEAGDFPEFTHSSALAFSEAIGASGYPKTCRRL